MRWDWESYLIPFIFLKPHLPDIPSRYLRTYQPGHEIQKPL